jgi:cation:H+ antiporter
LFGLALLAVAAVLLAVGADVYTTRVSALAARTRVTAIAIGLLLAGAEPEELVTAVIASARGHSSIAAGDAIGANVTMLTLVLGSLVLLQPLPYLRTVRPYVLAATAATLVVATMSTGGIVTRAEGAALVGLYLAFFAWVVVREHRLAVADGDSTVGPKGAHAVLALAGLGVVTIGGWIAVLGADRVVSDWGLAQSGVGLTLVAFATSAELLALIWAARRHQVTELALVALVGSVVGNATATMGAAALVRSVPTHGVVGAAWLAVALVALLAFPGLWTGRYARSVGCMLLAVYVAYCVVALS